MSISPHFEMSGDEARGLLYGLLEVDKIQLRKYPDMPSVREGIQNGTIKYKRADPDEHWQTYKEITDQIAFKGVAEADCEDLATAIAAEDQVKYGVQSLPFAYNPRPGLFHVVTAVPTDKFGRIPSGNWPAARGATAIPGYTFQDPSAAAGMGSFGAMPGSEASMDQYGVNPSHGQAGTAAAYAKHYLPGSQVRVVGPGVVGVFVPHSAGQSHSKVVRMSSAALRKFRARKYGDHGVDLMEGPNNVPGGLLVTFRSDTKPAYGARGGRKGTGLFKNLGGALAAFRQGAIGDAKLAELAFEAGSGARGASGIGGDWAKTAGAQIPGAVGIPTLGKPETGKPPKGARPGGMAEGDEDEDEDDDLDEDEEFGLLYGFDDAIESGADEAMGGMIGAQHFRSLANPSGFTRDNILLDFDDDDDDEFGAMFDSDLIDLFDEDDDDDDDDDDEFGAFWHKKEKRHEIKRKRLRGKLIKLLDAGEEGSKKWDRVAKKFEKVGGDADKLVARRAAKRGADLAAKSYIKGGPNDPNYGAHLRPPPHLTPPPHMRGPVPQGWLHHDDQRGIVAPRASFGAVYAEGHTPMDRILGAEESYGAIYAEGHTPMDRILGAEEAYGDDDDDDDDDDFGWYGADGIDDAIEEAVFGVLSRADLFGDDDDDDDDD